MSSQLPKRPVDGDSDAWETLEANRDLLEELRHSDLPFAPDADDLCRLLDQRGEE
ncbi:MAG: hypothetical protein ABEJ05_03760 [Haloglomus sp.]